VTETVTRGVLDTSTVILLGRLPDATALPDEPLITAITLAELSVGPLVASDAGERATRQAHLQQAEADFEPLPFDAAALGLSPRSPRPCERPVGSQRRGRTTR
jgi:predicted nucleic acid-binding protein